MLPLDDPRWKTYRGGYRDLYDASGVLRQLMEQGATEELWQELWEALHHQGDVDTASYAAVPYLLEYARRSPRLDWNVFGLIGIIELARPYKAPVPEELADAYFQAIRSVPEVVGTHPDQEWDAPLTESIVACIALARGQRILSRAYMEFSLDYARQWLEENVGCEREWEEPAREA